MTDTPPDPTPPNRRKLSPLLVAVLVVALLAVALAAIALTGDDEEDVGGELGAPGAGAGAQGPPGEASSTTAPAPPIPAAQKALFDQLMQQTAEVRGLQWKGPLNLRVLPRDELTRRLHAAIDRDEQPGRIAAEEARLKLLGLIPPDTNLDAALDAVYNASIGGFYDPKTKELFAVGDGGDDFDAFTKWTIVHEMTHALTDQVFNYGPATIALDEADRGEEYFAYSALLEGDASLTQRLWSEKHLSSEERLAAILGGAGGDVGGLARVPRYVIESLFFPYEEGLAFVQGLHAGGGFAAVDAAYRSPPTSSEHILHPETYRAGQTWVPPAVPDVAAAASCTPVRAGTLGQYDMRELLDLHLSAGDAGRAAEGWNGDSYRVVRCGTALGMADRWETDAGADPARLVTALAQWAAGWSGGGRPGADGRFTGPNGAGRIVRSGTRVDIVLAQDADTMEKLVRAFG